MCLPLARGISHTQQKHMRKFLLNQEPWENVDGIRHTAQAHAPDPKRRS